MRLEENVLLGLKNTLSHNAAQKLLQGKKVYKNYLVEVETLLVNMELDGNQLYEIMTYVRMKSRKEVKTIKEMFDRYGIKQQVEGHGGSEISVEVLLYALKEIATNKEED